MNNDERRSCCAAGMESLPATKYVLPIRLQPVFGIFERQGEVYTEIIPDCSQATL